MFESGLVIAWQRMNSAVLLGCSGIHSRDLMVWEDIAHCVISCLVRLDSTLLESIGFRESSRLGYGNVSRQLNKVYPIS